MAYTYVTYPHNPTYPYNPHMIFIMKIVYRDYMDMWGSTSEYGDIIGWPTFGDLMRYVIGIGRIWDMDMPLICHSLVEVSTLPWLPSLSLWDRYGYGTWGAETASGKHTKSYGIDKRLPIERVDLPIMAFYSIAMLVIRGIQRVTVKIRITVYTTDKFLILPSGYLT